MSDARKQILRTAYPTAWGPKSPKDVDLSSRIRQACSAQDDNYIINN
jgi:hypothetical protein